MRILQVVSSIDFSSGGPSKSVSDLAYHLAMQGQEVNILTKRSPNPYLKESPHSNLKLIFVNNTRFKSALYKFLNEKEVDIFHGHGLWQMPVHQMTRLTKKKEVPYIITPRGMLEPWALKTGKWKKKLALALYQRKDLLQAACIHATAQMEADNIRKLGFTNPIAVIPNGIDIKVFPLPNNKTVKEKNTILFLSRIHPKKGIENLIEAWKKLNKTLRQNWQIEIVGNGEENYIASLHKLINAKSLAEEVKIIGPRFGEAKLEAYHRADLFVLPTYSENFGIVVAEALACGVPVITTKGAPWAELNTHNVGWWIDIGVQPLAEALEKAMRLTDEERKQMGQNGRILVEQNYSIESVSKKMIHLYKWILSESEKPEFVLTT